MKTCTRCDQSKPLPEFKKDPRYAGGHVNWCRSCYAEYRAEYNLKNRDRLRAKEAARYVLNRDHVRKRLARNYQATKERHAERVKAARARNPEHYRQLANRLARERRAKDPAAKLRSRLSAQMNYCLKTGKGGATTEAILGYSIDALRAHLESLFRDGMSWGNLGEWHIDHIRPIASFGISGVDDPALREAWALSNLQPLWAVDNIKKGSLWNGQRFRAAA